MANILYGVNGEGAGHSTRSREIILHLQGEGHSVIGASFDRGVRNLSDICEVLEIHGFRFTYVNNQVRYNRTLRAACSRRARRRGGSRNPTRVIDERGIDLVITDYEPLTCRAGRRRKLPVISIDNQHILTHFKLATPPHCRADATAAKLATRMMTPYASHYLVTSFFDAPGRRSSSELVPPILRQQILDAVPTSEGSILVYVTTPAPQLIKLLASVQAEFIAYGFNREGREGNILYKKPSFETFFDDLVAAQAIVANAGFSLVTEALHLGKPYLAMPVRNQFEQIFNAFWLGRTGYGAYWEELTKERVESFLFNIPQFREKLAGYPRTSNEKLFARLDELIALHVKRTEKRRDRQRLAPAFAKKRLQDFHAAASQHAFGDFHAVVQAGMVDDLHDAAYGSGLGIAGAKTRREMRAWTMAPAHMAQGSRVT